MSLSSCEKCWDDPCTCGYGYRRWSDAQIAAQRDMLQTLLDGRTAGIVVRYVDPPPVKRTRAEYERSLDLTKSFEEEAEKDTVRATVRKMIDSNEQKRLDEYIDLIVNGDLSHGRDKEPT